MKDTILKLKMYKDSNIKVFLKVYFDEKSFSKHNGFIKDIKKEYIIFDDVIKGITPILIKDILKIDKSKFV